MAIPGRLSISEAFELYRMDYIVFKNQSPKTEENHIVCCRSLVSYFGDIPITDVTFPMIRDWKNHLSKRRTQATVRNYIIKLRVVLNFTLKRGYKVIDPETIPVPQRADTVVEYVTPEEVRDMIASFDTIPSDFESKLRSKVIISMFYGSALRVSELISLNKAHIVGTNFTVIGKGGKARPCFIDDRTRTLLDIYLSIRTDNHVALFYSNRGKGRMVSTNIQIMVKSAAKRVGIERHVTPHTLRHAFATDWTRNDGNMRHLQKILGHESLETTAMYAHVVGIDLERSHKKFHTI